MKTSPHFKTTIQAYLEKRAAEDELFAVTYAKEGKNIDDCITYILNTVKESGINGFDDSEVYSMAVHYYDEDDIEIGKAMDMEVIVNHKVKLTEKEIQKAKDDAMEAIKREQIIKMKKKSTPTPAPVKTPENNTSPKVKEEAVQGSLF